ncbi:MAG: serine hydrolase [Saprospiraceae bacterium]|nr:serine hydrolase [Saprospiraceae bacterium]
MKGRLLLVLAILLWVGTSHGQYVHQAAIDSLFTDWDHIESPGCAIGVVQNGELVYARGYGSADLEHDVPLGPHSVFYMASVSKQFVTFCILLLEEEGKIDLDAPIQTYLPDFPEYDAPLTTRHFIHHTSGVRDYLTLMGLKGLDYMDDSDPEEVYELIKRQSELNFPPGERYLYSNSCYFMLAMIVERVTGQSIKEYAEEHVFGPLGMQRTHFHDDNTHLIKHRAFSYEPREDGGYRNLIMRFDQVGSGGLYSCVEDMFLWDQNFYDNKLGKGGPEIMELMHTEGMLNNGERIEYAFGVSNGEYRGLRTVSHGGALAGYRTYLLRFPDQHTSIIFLGNRADADSGGNSYRIADIVLKDQLAAETEEMTAEEAVVTSTAYIPESLEPYAGAYSVQPGVDFTAEIDGDTLRVIQHWNDVSYAILPKDEHVFVIPQSDVAFRFSDLQNNQAQMVIVKQGDSETECRRKLDFELRAADMPQYVGSYYSRDLDCNYEIYLENETLMIRKPRQSPVELIFNDADTFGDGRSAYTVWRNGNAIAGFRLDAGRVTNLKFVRVK